MPRIALWARTALTCISIVAVATITAGRPSSAQSHPLIEAELVSEMHAANLLEIMAGELARSRGASPEIRNFGDLLVRDHTDFDRRVQHLAKKQGILLAEPQRTEIAEQRFRQLQSLDGSKFDKMFFESDQEAHRNLVQGLLRGTQRLQPSAARTLLSRIIPILRQHEFICGWCRNHCVDHKP